MLRSLAEMVGCCSGRWKCRFQTQTQMKPSSPGTMKAACQPLIGEMPAACSASKKVMSGAIISGARMAPKPVPAVMNPAAMLRSARGNHSATTRKAAGKFTDSVMPRKARAPKKLHTPLPRACRTEAMLHQMTASDSERLLPRRPISGPSRIWPAAYMSRKASVIRPYSSLVKPNSCFSTGAATDSASRST